MTKKLLLPFLILFCIPIYAQWNAQDSGVGFNLKDVYCITENVVVVVGDGGTIVKTTDGGAQWIQKTSGTSNDLKKLQFIDSNLGYAVGSYGTLLKTTDGGENWIILNSGTTSDLYGLSILNESTFYISGENSLIKKTIDGGNSFVSKNSTENQTVKSIQFLNELIGYALDGYRLKKTIDGGTTWTTIQVNDGFSSFYFVDENTGFMHNDSAIFKTSDSGENLSFFGEDFAGESNLFALNENTVWGVNNLWTLCNCESHCIVKSEVNDIGETHVVGNCNIGAPEWGIPFEGIYFANETHGYAVGWYGTIYKNTTGTMLSTYETAIKDAVKIYPNPASDHISVSFDGNSTRPFTVEITDFLGKNIYAKSYDAQNSVTIDTQSFSRGIYFLTLIGQDKRHTQKLIID